MDDETIVHVRTAIVDRFCRDLDLRPEALRIEIRAPPGGDIGTVEVHVEASALPMASDYPRILANARTIAQEEIDRHGLPLVLQ